MRWRSAVFGLACALALDSGVAQATDAVEQCPARGVSWTAELLRQCIDDVTKRIDRERSPSVEKAALLARRAELHARVGSLTQKGPIATGPEFDAALADYAAALAIAPRESDIRSDRARLLMRMDRGKDALKDAEALLVQEPSSVTFLRTKGQVLAMLKRHDEAIQVYSNALQLVQSCAEASSIQAQVNEYRHAFDPPPTKEEMLKLIQDPDRELHDKPEPAIALLGFACTPTPANSFNALVEEKWGLFNARGDSYLAMGNKWAALRDMQYAVAISGLLRKFSSVSLCALEIDLRLAASAVEDCRYAYDFNSYSLLGDPVQSAKIGRFLLEDGDLKGACRIAFPFFADESMSDYLNNPEIKALQERVKDALQGAGLTTCEIDYAAWLPKPK